ncbi:MAG: hypothetical protein Q7U51_09690 [Methanoregula sp.]|nr:hypothetical protein [Methanoregula sp.]
MIIADILTPVSIVLEFFIVIIGCYAGLVLKKAAGYLFAITFLLFGLYDFFYIIGLEPDFIAIINLIAVIAAIGGISLLARRE